MNAAENPKKALFPLKHVIAYKWIFNEASTLAEVGQRLTQNLFYTIEPKKGILVVTSLSKPAAVIFVFMQTEKDGGDLVLIQTPMGSYTYDHIARSIRVFAKIAGIKIMSGG